MTALTRPTLTLARAPAVDYLPRQSGKYTITPELAELWLRHVRNIRALSQATIEAYARDMRNGHWQENGETIKWDIENTCFDADHRLRACILAGVPFESWVIIGLPVQSAKTVDTGLKRQLAQILRGSGERYGTQIAGTSTLLWRWQQGAEALVDHKRRPTIHDLTDILESEPDLRTSVELAHGSYGKACRLSRSSTVPAFIHFMGFRTQGDKATKFLEQVASGRNISTGDPAYALRERLIKLGRSQNRFMQKDTLALWVPAWNAFAQDRELRRYAPMDYDNPEDVVLV